MPAPPRSNVDYSTEPLLTHAQVCDRLRTLPVAIATGRRKRLNSVFSAPAPEPFAHALADLEAYLNALDDAQALPFEHQIQLKDYALQAGTPGASALPPWRCEMTTRNDHDPLAALNLPRAMPAQALNPASLERLDMAFDHAATARRLEHQP